jgi:hypothetical protein
MGIFSNSTQERSWLSGYHLHNILSEDQECSLWPWCKCQSHVQGHVRKIGISCSFSNLKDSSTCWCIDLMSWQIFESLLVFVQGSCIFADFVVLDMQDDAEMPCRDKDSQTRGWFYLFLLLWCIKEKRPWTCNFILCLSWYSLVSVALDCKNVQWMTTSTLYVLCFCSQVWSSLVCEWRGRD